MDLQLTDRRAFVTASTGGIGAAIVRRLAGEGCAVLVHGRNVERSDALVAELRAAGAEADAVLGDLSDEAAADRVAMRAADWRTDILVNNAGPTVEHDWDTAAPAAWLASIQGNLLSAVGMVRALVPDMRARGWGRVINLGSRVAIGPTTNLVEYSAAKAAVLNATVSLARHLAGTGITANTVSPGVIVTDGMRQLFLRGAAERGWPQDWGELEPLLTAEYAPNPVGRLGTPDDIAAAVAFLASPLGGYIDGSNLRVDGGILPTV